MTTIHLDSDKATNREWKEIIAEKLKTATSFEIHCWAEEADQIAMLLPFGELKESSWQYGKVIRGRVSIDYILDQRRIENVDVIIGGPPCQAYSLVGRAQSSHMGTPMTEDPRNNLYKLYALFLQKYQPKMFVFENVMGIKSANGGTTWLAVQEALRSVGYEIGYHEQNSKNFGVLQNRRRMIIVGWLKDSGLS